MNGGAQSLMVRFSYGLCVKEPVLLGFHVVSAPTKAPIKNRFGFAMVITKNRYLIDSQPHSYDTRLVPYFPHFSTTHSCILPCKVVLDVISSYFSLNL